MRKKIGFFFAMTLIVLLSVFVVQNLRAVELSFLHMSGEMSLAVPIIVAYILGGLTAGRVWRFLNGQRLARKQEKKSDKAAADKLRKSVTSTAPAAAPKVLSDHATTNS